MALAIVAFIVVYILFLYLHLASNTGLVKNEQCSLLEGRFKATDEVDTAFHCCERIFGIGAPEDQ